MGKKSRNKREKRQKELIRSQDPEKSEAEESKALKKESLDQRLRILSFEEGFEAGFKVIVDHISRIDPYIVNTITEALNIRQLYNREKESRFTLYLKCARLMKQYHCPKTPCPDCGVDCVYQKEPPLPVPEVLIQDLGTQIAIRIINPKSLSAHNVLTKALLKSILSGEEQVSHTDAECKRMYIKAIEELRDLLSQVAKEVVREYGTANLSQKAQKELKYHVSQELNRNYDQTIDPEANTEPNHEHACTFLRFNKNGKPIYDEFGMLMYGPMASSIPVIYAICLDLPCVCPPIYEFPPIPPHPTPLL